MKERITPTIAVIGGGAAGLAAAIAAAETARGAVRVVVCEASDRVGRSILATGNGRCNFSNARLATDDPCDPSALYRNARFVERTLAAVEAAFPPAETADGASGNAILRFFADHGLMWREEGEGRLYPLANKASAVLDVLRAAAEDAGVRFETVFPVIVVERANVAGAAFSVRSEDGRTILVDRVIIATGGVENGRLLSAFDVPFVAQRPVLGPLAVEASDRRLTKRLDNIRVKATATLLHRGEPLRRESGEVLFRAYGLSGIAVFDLSREAEPGDEVSLDLLPYASANDRETLLRQRADRFWRRTGELPSYEDILRGMVLPSVAQVLCERAGARADEVASEKGLERLARMSGDLRFTVEGIGDVRQCQVARGGVAVEALDAATLEVASASGLHIVGEAVDVDAACGGFNLHWAWASGLLAGRAAAAALLEGVR